MKPPLLIRFTLLALSLALAGAATAQPQGPPPSVQAILATAPAGTRIGLLVVDDTGREIISILPDQRFMPGSNTKLITTATAFATLTGLDASDVAAQTSVALVGDDVVLTGRGDARLSSRPDCASDCLATLADAVAAKTKRVRDVIGDATWLADDRWSPGMSWNNIPTDSGTATAALSLDDNEIALKVTAGPVGTPPAVEVSPYVTIENRAVTVATGATKLDIQRLPFERRVVLTGTLVAGTPRATFALGIDDPADYAAWSFARLLAARGVKIKGQPRSRYRPAGVADADTNGPPPLATLTPDPLRADLTLTNKQSQNLHAQLLVMRLGREGGDGSLSGGLKAASTMLERAGVPRTAYDFADGSGMSSYNRISPRALVTLLRWAQTQPWGPAWRATFPVGGIDGTLKGRFKGTSLEGRIFAKTGTLNATAALSGYLTARSGRTFTFSIIANDVPGDAPIRRVIDAALVAVAEGN